MASLSGTVVDSAHAMVAGATVTLTNVTTGVSRVARSNQTGEFVFVELQPADYTLTLSAGGFKRLTESGIHLIPGDVRNLHEITLQPGAVSEAVTVTATSQGITLDSGTANTVISSEDIKHLSVEGRDVTELIKILPGFTIKNGNNNVNNTTYDPSQVTAGGGYGSYSGEGTISNSVALLYDGIDVTDPGAYGGALQNINYDQVSEVNVQTSAITADQAYGPIVINAVGKSGGDRLHGELYSYGRTSQLDSTDWLANHTGQAKPSDFEVYPGFALGGPIRIPHTHFNDSRRLTFFVAAEDYAQRNVYAYGDAGQAITTALVPTANMRNGDFSQTELNKYLGPLAASNSCVNGTITGSYGNLACVPITGLHGEALSNGQMGSNVSPTMQAMLNTLPLPNQATNSNGYNFAQTNLVNNNAWQGQARVDYAINDRNKIFAMYSTERGKQGVPQVPYYSPHGNMGGTNTPGGGMLADLNSEIGTLNWTLIITPTLTNNLSLSGAYFDQDYVTKDISALTLNGNWHFDGIFKNGSPVIPEFQDYGNDGLPVNLYPDTSEGGIYAKKWVRTGSDDLTKVIGRHTVRTGVYVQLDTNHQVTPYVTSNGAVNMYYIGGQYSGTSAAEGNLYATGYTPDCYCGGNYLADFLEGGVSQYSQTNFAPAPNLYFWTVDGYAQDHYSVTSYLSIDYGVRLNHLAPWADAHGNGIPVWMPSTYNSDPSKALNPSLPGFLWHSLDPYIPTSGLPSRWAFVEPRIGFALDVSHNGSTVVRGGAGIYTAHDSSNDIETPASSAMGERSATVNGPLLLADVPANAPAINSISGFAATQNGYGLLANDNHQPQMYTYNLALDQRAPFHSLFEIAYVGNVSRHLLNNGSTQPVTLDNINAIPVGTLSPDHPDPVTGESYPLVCSASNCASIRSLTTQQIDDYRPFPLYNQLQVGSHNINTNYNALQAVWNKQAGPLTFGFNYTWSKALGVLGASGSGTPADPFNYRNDYGPESFDRPQGFNATYSYTLGNVVHTSRILGGLVNRWMISGVTTVQSGPSILATNNPDFSMAGNLNVSDPTIGNTTYPVSSGFLLGTPDVYLMPRLTCNPATRPGGDHYINGSCYALPTAMYQNGSYRQPAVRGPAYSDSDLALQKSFVLGEGRSFNLRYSAFNFLNHANRTFTTSVDPNALILNESNGSTPQGLNAALSSATNNNADVFGYAPNRIGRRISEVQITINF